MMQTPISRRDAVRILAAAGGATILGATSPRPIITRRVPSSGEALPVIGLGTWQTFDAGPSEYAQLEEVLRGFVSSGGRLVDSSPMYGRSEAVLGELAARHRLHERLFVATKVWTSGREAGIRQMEESERLLRTKRIDLMQIHNLVDARSHIQTLRAWKESGRVRYIGITHYHSGAYDEVLRWIEREPLDFLQINYSVAEREAENRVLPAAAAKGVAVIVNRPFASGALFSKVRGKALPAWASEIGCASWAQLFLKFIIGHPSVTVAIPATAKKSHLQDNMQAAFGPLPSAHARRKIAELVTSL
jgi:diketogulonate reductase-like aldo/keto reductase